MEISKIKGEKYNYLLKTKGSRFYISDLVCDIINLMLEKKTNEEIATILFETKKIDIHLSAKDVLKIKEEHIRPMGILAEDGELASFESSTPNNKKGRKNSILFKTTILKETGIERLARKLTWLFHPQFFLWILLVSCFLNIILGVYFFQNIDQYINIQDIKSNANYLWEYILIYYPIAIIVLFLHELGHATPAYMFNTPPKSIGLGLYLVFPVLYADVTDSWALDWKQRMTVNIGGIYIQLVINALLLLLIPFVQQYELLASIMRAIILLNFATIFANINPFFKFDGYWLYSDYFHIPNLSKKATSYLRTLVFKNDKKAKQEIENYTTIWLNLYSYLYFAFLLFILYVLIQGLLHYGHVWQELFLVVKNKQHDFTTIFKMVSIAITTIIITVVLWLRIRDFYQSFLTKRTISSPL